MFQFIRHPIRSILAWMDRRQAEGVVDQLNWASMEAEVLVKLFVAAYQQYRFPDATPATAEDVIRGMLISVLADHRGLGPGFNIQVQRGAVACVYVYDLERYVAAVNKGISHIGRIY